MPEIDIESNLKEVRGRMAAAAERVRRDPEGIELVAVTKNIDASLIREAIQAGQRLFGENRVQEAQGKIEALGREVQWHLIGHLQTNKAKSALKLFDLIHSVDSLRLARELSKRCEQLETGVDILVQVNVSGEESKHGAQAEEAVELVKKVSALPRLRIKGLMTIPPFSPDPEDSRPYYRRLKEMSESVTELGLEGVSMGELSMGMSGDYEIAIEEGATMVRVGTAIFGPRVY